MHLDKDGTRQCFASFVLEVSLERLHIRPDEAIVVGDSPHDAEAAKKAGIRSIGFLCGGFSSDSLREAGMSSLFADPSDLFRRLDSALGDEPLTIAKMSA